MSRFYKLDVRTENTTKEELEKVLIDTFAWTLLYIDNTEFEGEGTLSSGMSEEEAHEEISKAIKKINPKAKVKTRWTYMEDLPYEEYGDDLEDEY